jgi:hypothetical protein
MKLFAGQLLQQRHSLQGQLQEAQQAKSLAVAQASTALQAGLKVQQEAEEKASAARVLGALAMHVCSQPATGNERRAKKRMEIESRMTSAAAADVSNDVAPSGGGEDVAGGASSGRGSGRGRKRRPLRCGGAPAAGAAAAAGDYDYGLEGSKQLTDEQWQQLQQQFEDVTAPWAGPPGQASGQQRGWALPAAWQSLGNATGAAAPSLTLRATPGAGSAAAGLPSGQGAAAPDADSMFGVRPGLAD